MKLRRGEGRTDAVLVVKVGLVKVVWRLVAAMGLVKVGTVGRVGRPRVDGRKMDDRGSMVVRWIKAEAAEAGGARGGVKGWMGRIRDWWQRGVVEEEEGERSGGGVVEEEERSGRGLDGEDKRLAAKGRIRVR